MKGRLKDGVGQPFPPSNTEPSKDFKERSIMIQHEFQERHLRGDD